MAKQAAQALTSGVPEKWPGAFGAYKYSKRAVRQYVWILVCAWLIGYTVIIVASVLFRHITILADIVNWLVSTLLSAFSITLWLAGVRDHEADQHTAWDRARQVMFPLLGLNILVGLALVGSFLAFIVPFFIVLPRLTLAPYYLVDKDMDVVEAFKTSWRESKGYSRHIWGIIAATFAMAALMVTIIGIPFSIYFLIMYGAATAVFYEYRLHQPSNEVVK